jgi:hypothetical protein
VTVRNAELPHGPRWSSTAPSVKPGPRVQRGVPLWPLMTVDVVFVRRRLDKTTSIPSMVRQTRTEANPRLARLWRDSFRGHE